MSFSYIICHRSSTKSRDRNLTILINYLQNLYPDIDIVLMQQDLEYKIDFPNIQNILVKQIGLFHRTRLFNMGFLKAKYDKIIFADNDVIISKEAIDETISKLDTLDCVNPYAGIGDLTEEQTLEFVYSGIEYLRTLPINSRQGICMAGGAIGFTRAGYIAIGGYDEEIVGWGAEDNLATHKILSILTYETLFSSTAYHLNHERTTPDSASHVNYENNCRFMNKILELTKDELIQYCEVKKRGLVK